MTKKIAVVLILFLLFSIASLIGTLYIINVEEQNIHPSSVTPTISPAVSSTPAPTSSLITYNSPQYGWEIQYPQEIKARVLPAEQTAGNGNVEDVNFYAVGKTQAEGTEFYDGMSLTVSIAKKSPTQSLRDFAEAKTSHEVQVATRDYFRETILNGMKGFEAQITGMGTFNHFFFPYSDDKVIWISYMTVGPDKAAYDAIVTTMLGSFTLTSSTTPSEPVGVCTMDAKVCPDGSTVGRQGPNCEFAACPSN